MRLASEPQIGKELPFPQEGRGGGGSEGANASASPACALLEGSDWATQVQKHVKGNGFRV